MTDMDQMRAAVVNGPGEAAVITTAIVQPGAGEVRVRIEGCGVCASNLAPWEGAEWMRYPTPPGGLGHEAWGVIDTLGAGVEGFRSGQRVTMLGEQGFAQWDVAPADHCVAIPEGLEGLPLAIEPVSCAFNIFRRANIKAGEDVAIIGIGFLGAILTRLASDAGARVIALSRRPFSLDLARDHGAAATVAMDDHWRAIEAVRTLTRGRGCGCVIEAAGKQWPLDLAGEIVAEGGRLVIAGYHQDGPRQVNLQQWNWKGIDVINAHERALDRRMQGMREAVAAIAAGRIDLDRLITHRLPLDRLGEALDLTRDRPDGFVKAVVEP